MRDSWRRRFLKVVRRQPAVRWSHEHVEVAPCLSGGQTKQQAVVNDRIARADLVITTAAVPGKVAPRLVDRATVERMGSGSVIVDLAADSGGNWTPGTFDAAYH